MNFSKIKMMFFDYIFFVVCFPLSTLAARWEASLKERKGRVNPGLKTAAKKVELKEAA